MRKEAYYQARIRLSIKEALEERMSSDGHLGSLNTYIEEVLLRYAKAQSPETLAAETGAERPPRILQPKRVSKKRAA